MTIIDPHRPSFFADQRLIVMAHSTMGCNLPQFGHISDGPKSIVWSADFVTQIPPVLVARNQAESPAETFRHGRLPLFGATDRPRYPHRSNGAGLFSRTCHAARAINADACSTRARMSKSHRPTADSRLLVRELAAMGTNVEDVARLTRIAPNTLRKYYSGEMDIGRANANLKVAQAMFKAATREERPNVVAMMFWLKNRAGWKDIGAPPPGGAGVRLLEVVFVRPGHDALDVTAKPNGAGTFAVAFDGG